MFQDTGPRIKAQPSPVAQPRKLLDRLRDMLRQERSSN